MTRTPSPLWPSRLHHIRLNSDQPQRLVDFYGAAMQLGSETVGDGVWALQGPDRRLLIGHGRPGSLGFAAFAVENPDQLRALRQRLATAGIVIEPSPTPLFIGDAFAIEDPDGNRLVFGLAAVHDASPDQHALDGRLQHVVVATAGLEAMTGFYRDLLGFLPSDYVRDETGATTAVFLRSDPEHHSIAAFRAPAPALDHHAYETPNWNAIRDWADRFAEMGVPIWWGPGRHGVGNNLFFMVLDPDGNKVELSAELEIMTADEPPGDWPHEQRSLNLWGQAWMRS